MGHRAKGTRRTKTARRLRQDSTFPERLLWSRLRDKRLCSLKFRRQHPIGPYVVDFYCEQAKLVIELDGESHVGRAHSDQKRTAALESHGVRMFRVTNDDVLSDLDAVCEAIARIAVKAPAR